MKKLATLISALLFLIVGVSHVWALPNCPSSESLYWNTHYRNWATLDVGSITSLINGLDTGVDFLHQPETNPWDWNAGADNHLPVLGGLMVFNYEHSSTDNPRAGEVHDEYYVQASIIVEGWEEF